MTWVPIMRLGITVADRMAFASFALDLPLRDVHVNVDDAGTRREVLTIQWPYLILSGGVRF